MPNSKSSNSGTVNPRLISFKRLRRLIGYLGIGLPVAMLFYTLIFSPCHAIEHSISAYYHTHARNVFVGILCAVGVFMVTYKGYDLRDTIASSLAGMFAFIVAMFPTSDPAHCEHNGLINCTVGTVHLAAATLLFLIFAYMSIALFRQTDPTVAMTHKKIQRNRLYMVCGCTIVGCILLIAAYMEFHILPSGIQPVFWLEAIALVAFGISWLTKGEGVKFLND